jgi:hypothetical protein
LENGKTVTLSGLLDHVPLEQALEMLRIYHLSAIVGELKGVQTRLTIIAERIEANG